MKTVITVRSLILHSFLVVIFAACGANATKKAEICSTTDSDIFVPGSQFADNEFTRNKNEQGSHPMLLPRENNYSNFENKSHPMLISPCPEMEK